MPPPRCPTATPIQSSTVTRAAHRSSGCSTAPTLGIQVPWLDQLHAALFRRAGHKLLRRSEPRGRRLHLLRHFQQERGCHIDCKITGFLIYDNATLPSWAVMYVLAI